MSRFGEQPLHLFCGQIRLQNHYSADFCAIKCLTNCSFFLCSPHSSHHRCRLSAHAIACACALFLGCFFGVLPPINCGFRSRTAQILPCVRVCDSLNFVHPSIRVCQSNGKHRQSIHSLLCSCNTFVSMTGNKLSVQLIDWSALLDVV